ncbi:HlyD family efflux transporter periplasmic adaptor subunit [Duganella sp. CY15W]|uniref:HlyD family secretion protein n=1 Tax=Duganella sp. CY15W TaxID=2692172 RepID=UPI001369491A|nr:HlyD family efflux transporter periplasmic adaptor subunit [Duganella sp. CY15W]MYM30834.1 HlyD family efflux transporter periplasmic adaptor subunit [Duganella sp. CY15W]
MKQGLFREEVLAAKQTSPLGAVFIMQPLSLKLLAGLACACAVGLILFLGLSQYAARVTAFGIIAPSMGLLKVQSPNSGIVLRRSVQAGQQVRAGQVLYTVSSEMLYSGGRVGALAEGLQSIAARAGSLAAEQGNTTRALERDMDNNAGIVASLAAEIRQSEVELAIQEERFAVAGQQYQKHVEAQAQGYISSSALQLKYELVLEQKARLQSMRREQLTLRRSLAGAEHDAVTLRSKKTNVLEQFERQQLALEQERVTMSLAKESLVTAPGAGTVASVLIEPGQRIDKQVLLTILPDGARYEAVVYLPSKAIAHVRPNDAVRLRIAAFPYLQFGSLSGTVLEVSNVAMSLQEIADEVTPNNIPVAKNDGLFRVRVALPGTQLLLAGKTYPFRTGMQIEAEFLHERLSLLRWIFRPLYELQAKG